MAGALACTERQMAQGLERTLATSECAWVASTAARKRTRNTHAKAAQRNRRPGSQRFLVFKRTFGYKVRIYHHAGTPNNQGVPNAANYPRTAPPQPPGSMPGAQGVREAILLVTISAGEQFCAT